MEEWSKWSGRGEVQIEKRRERLRRRSKEAVCYYLTIFVLSFLFSLCAKTSNINCPLLKLLIAASV